MIETYRIKITDEAQDDMEKIYEYIAGVLLSPENALGQYNRIADEILALETFPEKFSLFDTEPEHSMGIHKMIVDNYIVCYVIDPGVVTVTDVLYGASDIHMRLMQRHYHSL